MWTGGEFPGPSAAVAVVVAVFAALTLLPALLGIIGPHINSLRVRDRHPESHPSEGGLWAKWATKTDVRLEYTGSESPGCNAVHLAVMRLRKPSI